MASRKAAAFLCGVIGALACSVSAFGAAATKPVTPARPTEDVDVALVIAIDVSGSVDDSEAFLQRKGVSDAFRTKEIVQAIRAGSLGRIAVTSVDFSSRFYNKVIVPWRVINDEKSATDFAGLLLHIPRTYGHGTSISDAIELGQALLASSPYTGTKKVIDISGDGPNNFGKPVTEVREAALKAGITINGLPVMEEDGYGAPSDLDKYFAACVIGGPGAFIQVAKGFADFSRAIRRKLVLELSSLPTTNPLLAKVAAQNTPRGLAAPRPGLARPRAGRPEYAPGCDFPGFFP